MSSTPGLVASWAFHLHFNKFNVAYYVGLLDKEVLLSKEPDHFFLLTSCGSLPFIKNHHHYFSFIQPLFSRALVKYADIGQEMILSEFTNKPVRAIYKVSTYATGISANKGSLARPFKKKIYIHL